MFLNLFYFTGLPIHLAQQVPPTMASTVVGGCPIKLRAISISNNSNSANQWTNLTSTFSNPHTLANHCRMIHPADFHRKSTLKFHPIPIHQEGPANTHCPTPVPVTISVSMTVVHRVKITHSVRIRSKFVNLVD